MPSRLTDLKKAAARSGALTALIRAKAWVSDLEPADLAKGFPSIKEDGSDFNTDDLAALTKELRPLASQLAEDTDLSHFQAVYDANNKKIKPTVYEAPPLDRSDY